MAKHIRRCLLNERLSEIGMTQTQLADKLKISRTQITDWANTRIVMSLGIAKKIAKVLNCKIEDLYEWEEE